MTGVNSNRESRFGRLAACVAWAGLLAGCIFDVSGRAAPETDAQVQPDAWNSVCNNGEQEPGETCDGSDLNGETCEGLGFAGGVLGCTTECELDDTQCDIGGDCGNGSIDGMEQCDGSELDGRTCGSETTFTQGVLACTGQCAVDVSDCHTCGNGQVEGPEGCDGALNGRECGTEGFDGGDLVCGGDCQLDVSGCWACGDGVCEAGIGETRQECPVDCGWVDVSAGAWHTCAVSGDGELWCWGFNDDGQLGDASFNTREEPTFVPGLSGVASVSAGGSHTCATLNDGTLWCWGADDDGQLGVGGSTGSNVPVQIVGLNNVVAVAAGMAHTCALSGQTLWCWGLNDKGQVGADITTTPLLQPTPVVSTTGLNLALSVTAGSKHSCAPRTDQTAWCWGDKGSGRLGDGTNTDQLAPAPVDTTSGLLLVEQISAGDHHTCAVASGGAPWCWGARANGRLGSGSTGDEPLPVPVSITTGLVVAKQIVAGKTHTCAIDSADAAWCWGGGADGQLGDGTDTEQTLPTPVDVTSGLTAVLMITTGELHTCALKNDNTVWCWGLNDDGQLGDGSFDPQSTPMPILGD